MPLECPLFSPLSPCIWPRHCRPSTTQTECGLDETASGRCGGTSNTLTCTACKCQGGEAKDGACTCPKGEFKTGSCSSGFTCKSCERESKQCDAVLEYRIGECGNTETPYNTWDCEQCLVAGTQSEHCTNEFEYRTGNCQDDKEFGCAEQPDCDPGSFYQPGASTVRCSSLPGSNFPSNWQNQYN